jgi:hypothetical protein
MRPNHRTLRPAAALALLLAALAGCDDSTRVQTFPLTVQVEYPATYGESAAAGARVVLRSTERGTADTLTTNAAGQATFPEVVPGLYEVTAARALTTDEAFQLTGNRAEVQLNARLDGERLDAAAGPLLLRLAGSTVGGWVIKEVYYTGSRTPSNLNYFLDQFYELHNNSTDTLYAGGLMLGILYGPSGQINPNTRPTPFADDPGHVYADAVWRIPGTDRDRPVPPGGSVLIAQVGIDHRSDPNANPASPVNLGNADWEMYVNVPESRDIDSPTVPNMEMLHRRFGFYALAPVFGPAVVLFRGDFDAMQKVPVPTESPTSPPVVRIPVASVLDAFEALQNEGSGSFKRVPPALDAGFVHASGTYTGQSARRRVERTIAGRRVLRDTNDSRSDFEIVAPPTPRGF